MFDFVMKMFSEGDATALGMEEIPKQLAIQLPADFVQYKVVDIRENTFYHRVEIKSDIIILAGGKRTCFEIKK
jgi:hypothetical protein